MLIFLVGMPGSGKSFWSKKIAKLFNAKALDMDEAITQHTGQSISRMFEISETYFRTQEQEVLTDIIAQHQGEHLIVATGGGAPCYADNMDLMKKNGVVIYLSATPKFLMSRLKQSKIKRPLLESDSDDVFLNNIINLYDKRAPIYEKAPYHISAIKATISNFAIIIQPHLNK